MHENINVDPHQFGSLLLDIGMGLLRAGASGSRIRNILDKTAAAYQYSIHLDLGPKSISVSLLNSHTQTVFNGTRSTQSYGVNFKVISGLNRLSDSVSNKQWSLPDIRKEVDRLLNLPHYSKLTVLLAVSIAGAGFCYTFGGRFGEMGVTFGATFCGLFLKQKLQAKSVNPYVCTFLSALTAALFTGLFYITGTGIRLEHAYATCTLFLIPGVPLLNCFIDLVEGNILYGLERGVNAMMHAFAIALGLSMALLIYNIPG